MGDHSIPGNYEKWKADVSVISLIGQRKIKQKMSEIKAILDIILISVWIIVFFFILIKKKRKVYYINAEQKQLLSSPLKNEYIPPRANWNGDSITHIERN